MKQKLLFICLGNICRSPGAHAIMQKLIEQNGLTDRFEVDSAGIGDWHVGQLPDKRMMKHGLKRGYDISHRARQFNPKTDFDRFDYIFVMDNDNYRTITSMTHTAAQRNKVRKMADYFTEHAGMSSVPDPYYGNGEAFELTLDLIEDGCRGILRSLSSMMKVVILDFDGTLGNTNRLIIDTMMATFDEMGLKRPSRQVCQGTIGLPLARCFAAAVPALTDSEAERCATTYRRIFSENRKPGAVPLFPHVMETLRQLHRRGTILTIASSRGHNTLMEFVRELQLEPLVSLVLGVDDVARPKPDAQPVQLTLQHFGLKPQDALVVGDTEYDILMGKNAGCRTCGVTYGNGSLQELQQAGATYIIDDFSKLLNL